MTDEEMAKEYANENKEVYGSDEYADITDYNNIKRVFLAGLKAGRPEWHDLRKDPNAMTEEMKKAIELLIENGNLFFEDYEGKRSPITYVDIDNEKIIFKE